MPEKEDVIAGNLGHTNVTKDLDGLCKREVYEDILQNHVEE